MSGDSETGLIVLAVVAAAVIVWLGALVSCLNAPEQRFKSGSRTSWVLVIIFLGVLGAIVYWLVLPAQDGQAHKVYRDPRDDLYWCRLAGSSRTTSTK